MTDQLKPLLVNASEAMHLLDIKDPRVLKRLIRDGSIHAVRVGNRWKINYASLEEFASGQFPAPPKRKSGSRQGSPNRSSSSSSEDSEIG